MKMLEPDESAARVHRRNAERHYAESERLRALGLDSSAEIARSLGVYEDTLADALLLLTTATRKDLDHG